MALTNEELEEVLKQRYGTLIPESGLPIDAGEASIPAYVSNQLRGAEAFADIFGVDREAIQQQQQVQEQQLSRYQPEISSLFEAQNIGEGVEWWKDQAILNSLNQVVPMLGYTTANLLKIMPHPIAKGAGNFLMGTTAVSQYNAELGDTLQEHEDRAGRPLSTQEKMWAGVVSMGTTALDYLVPGKMSKDLVKQLGGPKGVKNLQKRIVDNMKQNRLKLSQSLSKGAKYVGGKAALETGTEAAQKALQIVTSQDPGYVASKEGLQSIVEEAVSAGPVGGALATPGAIGVATEQNRSINRAIEQANRLNQQLMAQGDVNKFFKYRIEDIPEKVGFGKRFEDVQKKLQTIGDVGVFKAPMQIKRDRDAVLNNEKVKPENKPKAYQLLNRTLQRYLGVSNMSGEEQIQESFDNRKATVTGELLAKPTEVLNKYTKKRLAGLGTPVLDKERNDYIRDVLRGKKKYNSRPDLITPDDMQVLIKARDTAGKRLQSATGSGIVENYIQEPISVEVVKNDREGFIASLLASSKLVYDAKKKEAEQKKKEFNPDRYIYNENSSIAKQNAEEIADSIINGRDPNVVTSKYIKDQMKKDKNPQGQKSFEKSRSEEWRNLDDKYREQDIGRVLEGYFQKAGSRIASAEIFGAKNADKLQKDLNELQEIGGISQDTVDRVWDLYDAVHNVYRRDVSSVEQDIRKASKLATEVAAITHLGLATISSLTELVWVGERSGFGNMLMTLPKAFNYAFKGARKVGGRTVMEESEGWRTLANLGHNLNPHVNDRLDAMFSTDRSLIVNAYFRSPMGGLLTQWTNFNRNWAAQAALANWNTRAKKMVTNSLEPIEERRLRNELKENGITINEFQKIAELSKRFNEDNAIKINVVDDKFLDTEFVKDDGTRTRVRDIVVPWLHKTVDEVVVHPRATNKPMWMSNPSFAMIAQLKTFPIVFGNTVVKRLLRKVNPKNCTTDMGLAISAVGAMGMAFAIAYIAEQMKAAIKGQDPRDLTWLDYGNLTGLTGAGGLVMGAGKFGDLTSSLLGPAIDSAINKTNEEILNPFYEGKAGEVPGNLVDWFAESVDSSLGPVGIYFKPASSLAGVEDE